MRRATSFTLFLPLGQPNARNLPPAHNPGRPVRPSRNPHPGSMVWTHEYVNGVRQQEECAFADFDSLTDGFTAHGELLAQAPAYAAARACLPDALAFVAAMGRSEEHTSELQSRPH